MVLVLEKGISSFYRKSAKFSKKTEVQANEPYSNKECFQGRDSTDCVCDAQ